MFLLYLGKIIVDKVLTYQPDILPKIYNVLDKFNIKYKPRKINKNHEQTVKKTLACFQCI